MNAHNKLYQQLTQEQRYHISGLYKARISLRDIATDVDVKLGLTHTFTTTAVNEHYSNQAHHLLHGEEEYVFADSGYRGAQKREELKGH
jgi:IS5 family transposase